MDWDAHYESLWAFVEDAQKREKYSRRWDRSFTWTDDMGQAVALAKEGWSEVRDKVRLIADGITHDFSDRIEERHTPNYDVTGGSVDVGRFLMGEPECMIDFIVEPVASIGKVVHVMYNGSVSGSVSTEALSLRGATCLALIDVLEALGYSTVVDVQFPVRNAREGKAAVTIRLKNSDEIYDADSLTFAIAHPSMLRRLIFGWWDGVDAKFQQSYGIGNTYGYPTKLIHRGDINVDSEATWQNPDDAKRWVLSMIDGLEVGEG